MMQSDTWEVKVERATTPAVSNGPVNFLSDDTVQFDSLGRAFRWSTHAADPASGLTLVQSVDFDHLGRVEKRYLPISQDLQGAADAESYVYDTLGRVTSHMSPWSALTSNRYVGRSIKTIDANNKPSEVDLDPLGRVQTVTDALTYVTTYAYGPFGAPWTVTAPGPGNSTTTTIRDAYGRIKSVADPDSGTTSSDFDGFGQLIDSTDANGRVAKFTYDNIGRTVQRIDTDPKAPMPPPPSKTHWTWDTSNHGRGQIATATSPEGHTQRWFYDPLSRLSSTTLSLDGDIFEFSTTYDQNTGLPATLTYPQVEKNGKPFVIGYGYDNYGHVISIDNQDPNAALWEKIYWQLQDVDVHGNFQTEALGIHATTARTYDSKRNRVSSINTAIDKVPQQSLSYQYDINQNLISRTDALQKPNGALTEVFGYDAIDRLTCATIVPAGGGGTMGPAPQLPCATATPFKYDPNGNLTWKVDTKGNYVESQYADKAHPHAVTGRGAPNQYHYDDVGNQGVRPGTKIDYTPFNLPKTIQDNDLGTFSYLYDANQTRIRKETQTEITEYFGGLYERLTDKVENDNVTQTYYVQSPQRVVAIVKRPTDVPACVDTRFIHTDNLGSTDVISNGCGMVKERRSYDAFGAKRNPHWKQASGSIENEFPTRGFTGQEEDELDLINMKGRIYDPKLGRFLTKDPVVSEPSLSQGWNPYSYVLNNPLGYVDPTGFQDADPADAGAPPGGAPVPSDGTTTTTTKNPDGTTTTTTTGPDGRSISITTGPTTTPPADQPGNQTKRNEVAGDLDGKSGSSDSESPTVAPAGVLPPPLGWTPPGAQPIRWWLGTQAHLQIAAEYRAQHPGELVFSNVTPLSTIAKALKGNVDALGSADLLRPDILNEATREIYEIKPYGSEPAAAAQLVSYIAALKRAGIFVRPGGPSAGTSGIVPAPNGYYGYWLSSAGVISYQRVGIRNRLLGVDPIYWAVGGSVLVAASVFWLGPVVLGEGALGSAPAVLGERAVESAPVVVGQFGFAF